MGVWSCRQTLSTSGCGACSSRAWATVRSLSSIGDRPSGLMMGCESAWSPLACLQGAKPLA